MPSIACLFPGQGAQFVGMGAKPIEANPRARGLFDRAAEVLGYDLLELCLKGPEERLNATDVAQPALFVCSLAALEVWREIAPAEAEACTYAAGLSLGEYTAITMAGGLSFEEGLRVVQIRGRAMQAAAEANPSGMTSVLIVPREDVQKLCDDCRLPGETLQIANLLCPGNTVVAGHKPSLAKLAERTDLKMVQLSVAGAFHTSLMASAVEELRAALTSAKLERPRIPIVSNVDAAPHDDPEEIRDLLIRQVESPVRWEDSMRKLVDLGVEKMVEVGPGRVLAGLMKRIDRKFPFDNVEG